MTCLRIAPCYAGGALAAARLVLGMQGGSVQLHEQLAIPKQQLRVQSLQYETPLSRSVAGLGARLM